MLTQDLERFEAAAGGLLEELGYARAFPRLTPERFEDTSRTRKLVALDPGVGVEEGAERGAEPGASQ
jgi:hypothetical protein